MVVNPSPVIGYLLASSLYFVCWFTMKHDSNIQDFSVGLLESSHSGEELAFASTWSLVLVARSDAVLLVDLILKECNMTCLMKIEILCMDLNCHFKRGSFTSCHLPSQISWQLSTTRRLFSIFLVFFFTFLLFSSS